MQEYERTKFRQTDKLIPRCESHVLLVQDDRVGRWAIVPDRAMRHIPQRLARLLVVRQDKIKWRCIWHVYVAG